jgi:hypothetical protein
MEHLETILRRAAAIGCNGVVLTEYSFNRPGPVSPSDRARADRVKHLAAELGIEIIPTVFSPKTLLLMDANLAEGLPVRNALYVVRDGVARLQPDPLVRLNNPGFEDGPAESPSGWLMRTSGGIRVRADTTVSRSGSRSLQIVGPDSGNARVDLSQGLDVSPFRQYHVSLYARTKGFADKTALQAWVSGSDDRLLNYPRWSLSPDAGWTRLDCTFDSLANRRVTLRLSAVRPRGTLWIDAVSVEETGFVNLLRRPGCPLTVTDGSTVYVEGKDYERVTDPGLGRTPRPGAFADYHTPPDGIRLTASSRIGPSARLRVSYYYCPVIYGVRVTQCLTEPAADDLMQREARRVQDLLSPTTWMMSHDEMRVMNQCEACRRRGMTPGELLADNVRRCAAIVRGINPKARLAIWSDMFDPAHNARDNFYLVNGSLSGSWNGLPADITIVNWNSIAPAASLRWFANRGFHQVIAAYYDEPLDKAAAWLQAARGVKGIDGIMYTTWQDDYKDLEAFARLVWQ